MIYEQQEIFYTWSSKDEHDEKTESVHIINVVTNPIIEKKWMDDLILYNISIMAGPFQDGNHKATKEFTVHTCLDSKHNIDLVVSSVA